MFSENDMDWMALIEELANEALEKATPLLLTPENIEKDVKSIKERGLRVDKASELAILEGLKRRRIPCTLVSEDIGMVRIEGGSNIHIVVDPIDGTTNASRGIPYSAISIAVSDKPKLSGVFAGIVLNVFTGEKFTAERGCGAYRGKTRIRTSEVKELKDAVVSMDLSKRAFHMEWALQIARRVSGVRHLGSASIELSYVAMGRMDAHVDLRWVIRPVDVAAGILILREAGGAVYTQGGTGRDVDLKPGERMVIVGAANQQLLEEIFSTVSIPPPPKNTTDTGP